MNKNTVVLSTIIALLVGLGVGVCVRGFDYRDRGHRDDYDRSGMHMMPNGSYMSNDGERMDMADMMASMNGELEGKTGAEFDKAFLTEMIVHHEGAVAMAKLALQHAEHQEVKDLATAIISAQNKEIGDMKSWLQNWFGSSQIKK